MLCNRQIQLANWQALCSGGMPETVNAVEQLAKPDLMVFWRQGYITFAS